MTNKSKVVSLLFAGLTESELRRFGRKDGIFAAEDNSTYVFTFIQIAKRHLHTDSA